MIEDQQADESAHAPERIERSRGCDWQLVVYALMIASGGCELLLLDEPTALLDPASQQDVLTLIRELTQRRPQPLTALWITHRLEELQHCDGAALMRDGRIGPWQSGEELTASLVGA